ncbi:MAG: SDR family oxidoreductase [Gemmatimonadales bacterium]|nr:MAG: SDR family oxidoreductase [Gemmatimonadales bacterium]
MGNETEAAGAGIGKSPDPTAEERAAGGPGGQQQEWPGSDAEMEPRADHGEESYRGSGRLEGRRALITGGDSGIGRAVAIAFAREGADVAISYLSEDEDAAETVRWIEKAGRRALALPGDLTEPEACREVVKRTVTEFGGLDLLVNNLAAHWEQERLEDISDEQLDRTFRTNILSVFQVTRAALEHLEKGSAIINTGSVVALRGSASLLDYAASKGAVHVFTKSLSAQVAERGIRVNCVAPGPVWTPLIPSTRDEDEVEDFGADTAWERPAQPAEIAPAYVFFASADSRFCTGEILAVSGQTATR